MYYGSKDEAASQLTAAQITEAERLAADVRHAGGVLSPDDLSSYRAALATPQRIERGAGEISGPLQDRRPPSGIRT